MSNKIPFHQQVATRLIEQLKAGTAPWQKPWEPGHASYLPINPTTGKRYKGINTLYLSSQGYSDNRWLTYNQATAINAQVNKGERGTAVQYWKFTDERIKKDEQGKPILDDHGKPVKIKVKLERPKVFFATVFNAEQIDGMPPPEIAKVYEWDDHERAEKILANSNVTIRHDEGDRAYYQVSTDTIHLPNKTQFPTQDRYYATALHELGHATGHPSRLDRDLANPFGSESYAKEELRAEISSMILGDELHIGHDGAQHVSYVKSWIKALQDDPMEIFRAAADAEKIHKFVMNLEHTQELAQLQETNVKTDPLSILDEPDMQQRIHDEEQKSAQTPPRIFINVPFKEKEQAKEMGAKWDRSVQSWYIPDNVNAEPFSQWPSKTEEPAAEQKQTPQTAHDSTTPQNDHRTYLTIPYGDRKQAKTLGAKWDKPAQSWYVPDNVDIKPFSQWTDAAKNNITPEANKISPPPAPVSIPQPRRIYLAVPYKERDTVKALGAKWDKTAKSWYVPAKRPLHDTLKPYLPENVSEQQSPSLTPREEFADALRAAGCEVTGEHPIMDGSKQRIRTDGDKAKETAGFYFAYLDGHPAGFIKNNRTGEEIKWKSKGYSLSPKEKAKMMAEAATKLAERETKNAALRDSSSKRVSEQLAKLKPIETPTPYLTHKNIGVHSGTYTDDEGLTTFIPAYDTQGKQWTMQYINADGTKRFAKDSQKEGSFHVIGGQDALKTVPAIVIGEGYATAATLTESLGYATVAAFDAGNLIHVAKALREQYPDKLILIAGDDDKHLEMMQGVNPGKEKAEKAAKAVGGYAMFPHFALDEKSWPDTLEPVTPEKWKAKAISDEQSAALNRIKQYTDFNDLKNLSTHGTEGGLHWQINQEVEKALKRQLPPPILEQQQNLNQHRARSR